MESTSSQATISSILLSQQMDPKESVERHRLMFLPMDGTGHVLTMMGLAYRFLKRHHEVHFVVNKSFAKYVAATPFKIHYLLDPLFDQMQDPQERWAKTMARNSVHFHKPPIEQAFLQGIFHDDFVNTVININDQLEAIISQVRPDFMFVDYYVAVPAVILSKIPWACVVSANPLANYQAIPNSPPHYSGYSLHEDGAVWQEFKNRFKVALSGPCAKLHAFAAERGLNLPPDRLWIASPYYNIYVYPPALDYCELSSFPLVKWYRLDHCIRPFSTDPDPLGLDLTALKPQLPKIYFTLGSMGSADIVLMDMLLTVFANTNYQYIVSMGPNADKITLPHNAIGAGYINQLKILPQVDLVIFHGGNNTLIECLYFGKKMLLLPLFGDQFDNAARMVDRRLGLALRPYSVKPEELKSAIHTLMQDDSLHNRLTSISNALKTSSSMENLLNEVDLVVRQLKRYPQSIVL